MVRKKTKKRPRSFYGFKRFLIGKLLVFVLSFSAFGSYVINVWFQFIEDFFEMLMYMIFCFGVLWLILGTLGLSIASRTSSKRSYYTKKALYRMYRALFVWVIFVSIMVYRFFTHV